MTLIGPALIGRAILGSLLLAVLSTVADYVWFLGIPQHQVSSGSIHGALLFAALGGYLGWRKGKAVAGAIGGLVSGLLAALQTHLSTSHWVSSASSTVNGLATLRVTVTKNS